MAQQLEDDRENVEVVRRRFVQERALNVTMSAWDCCSRSNSSGSPCASPPRPGSPRSACSYPSLGSPRSACSSQPGSPGGHARQVLRDLAGSSCSPPGSPWSSGLSSPPLPTSLAASTEAEPPQHSSGQAYAASSPWCKGKSKGYAKGLGKSKDWPSSRTDGQQASPNATALPLPRWSA